MPCETGMDRFIHWRKPVEFIGRAAAMAERTAGPARVLCAFVVDTEEADVVAYEPIWLEGSVQGFCTPGGYAHHSGLSVAMGFVPGPRDRRLPPRLKSLGNAALPCTPPSLGS